MSLTCAFCSLPVPSGFGRSTEHTGGQAALGTECELPAYCCYGCRFAASVARSRAVDEGTSWILVRLGTAVFLSMNVMLFGLFLYSSDLYHADPAAQSSVAMPLRALCRYASLLLTTPVLVILGLPIIENALAELRARRISTDLLFAGGVLAAFSYSVVTTLRGAGNTYFDTTCMILVLVTLGKWLEATGKLQTSRAVESLRDRIPDEVRVIRREREMTIPSSDVRVGDHVRVSAGEYVPVDGVILEHEADFNEQMLTGESVPVHRSAGQEVFSGSISIDGSVVLRATAVGGDATMGRLIALVDEARLNKGRFERLADRLAGVFVPGVTVLALAAAGLTYTRSGLDAAIMTLLAVVLISCPCALGLATPMAVWTAMGAGARFGVLFRNSEALERLAQVRTVLFDKTGTLTDGDSTVTSFVCTGSTGRSERDVLAVAHGLAARSTHHVARAIERFAEERGVPACQVTRVTTMAGGGMRGILPPDGEGVCLGNRRLMDANDVRVDAATRRVAAEQASAEAGIALLGRGHQVEAVFRFSERIRPEAADSTAALRRRGIAVRMLTGDHSARGRSIAEQLGMPVEAELSPQQKLDRVRALAAECATAMVGDGINDAPALVAADVGIAMGCGADVARESADVCLMNNDLTNLLRAIDLSRATIRTIKQNLFWALGYNTAGIALAMTGRLHPIVASLAMVLSSALVVANSRRLNTRGGCPASVVGASWKGSSVRVPHR